MPQVVLDHRLDEVVAVVVAGMAAQGQRLADGGAGVLQRLGMQLVGKEFVGLVLLPIVGNAAGAAHATTVC